MVKIYWGGEHTVIRVGEANISDLVTLCLDHGRQNNVHVPGGSVTVALLNPMK
jgi:hypothetical protein